MDAIPPLQGVQKEARRRIDARPAPPPTDPSGPSYWAPQRVKAVETGRQTKIHESDGDLPICQLRGHFDAENIPREQLPPGPVDCGHCASMNA